MTLTEFLLARIAEDEAAAVMGSVTLRDWEFSNDAEPSVVAIGWTVAQAVQPPAAGEHIARHDPTRVLAECEAKRRIVEWHQNWPVLAQTEPELEFAGDPTDVNAMSVQMHQHISWLTEQQYRERFGDEPPTSPILRFLALPYADHPDYDPAWSTK